MPLFLNTSQFWVFVIAVCFILFLLFWFCVGWVIGVSIGTVLNKQATR